MDESKDPTISPVFEAVKLNITEPSNQISKRDSNEHQKSSK